jgi:vitamin B12 transporter
MTGRYSLLMASTAILTSPSVQAQDGATDLGLLVLSGGLTPIEASAYGRASTVLTSQDIQERGISSLQDALRAVPGISVNSAGSSLTQVRIRGGEGSHTLILIDGVRAAGGDGEYYLSGLDVLDIERLEVLRGPQSVYYGTAASAGVINIITRKGGQGQQGGGKLEFGGAATLSLHASSRGERGGLSFSFTHVNDEGWDFSNSGGEKDFTNRSTFLLSGDVRATPNLKLGFTYRDSLETYASDTTSGGATRWEDYVVDGAGIESTRDERTASLYAELSMLEGRLTHRLSFESTENEQSYGFAPTVTSNDAIKYRVSYGLDGQAVDMSDQVVSLLLENAQDSSSANPGLDRENTSLAVEYRGSFANGLDLQLGARKDNNNRFADFTTWNASVSYAFGGGVRLHSSAGTGYVNPSYFEIGDNYYAAWFPGGTNSSYLGNPNLTPERNRSFDIGVEFPVMNGTGFVDVTYFNETLEDEVQSVISAYDSATNTLMYSFFNDIGESTREGVELTAQFALSDSLDLRAAYTYLDAKNPNGSVEIRRPRHEASLGASMRLMDDRMTVSADLRHVAGNFDTQYFGSYATEELPAFTTVNVSTRYAISDVVTLTGRVENLFDSDAMETWGYVGRPRTVYVGLDARF